MDEASKVKKEKVKDKEKKDKDRDKPKKQKDHKEKEVEKPEEKKAEVQTATAALVPEAPPAALVPEAPPPTKSKETAAGGSSTLAPAAQPPPPQQEDGASPKKVSSPKKRGRPRKVDSTSEPIVVDLEKDTEEPDSKREKKEEPDIKRERKDNKESKDKKERREKKDRKERKDKKPTEQSSGLDPQEEVDAEGQNSSQGQEPDILDTLFGAKEDEFDLLFFGNHASAQEWNEAPAAAVAPDVEAGVEPNPPPQRTDAPPVPNTTDAQPGSGGAAQVSPRPTPPAAAPPATAAPIVRAPIVQHLMQPALEEEIPSLAIACKASTLDGLVKDEGRYKRVVEELAKVHLDIQPPGTVECRARNHGDAEAPARASCLIRAMVAMNDSKAAQGALHAAGLKPAIVQSPRALHDVVLDLAWRVGEEHSLLMCFASEDFAETSLAGVSVSPGLAVQARYGKGHYDAEVVEDAGAQVRVKYAYDGSVKKLPKADVKKVKQPTLPAIGEMVKAKYGHKFYDAEVLSVENGKLNVRYKYDDSEAEVAANDVQRKSTGRDLEVEPLYIFGAEHNVPDGMLRLFQTFVAKGTSVGVDNDFFLEHQSDPEKDEMGYTVVNLWETWPFNGKTSSLKTRIRTATASAVEVWSERDLRSKSSGSRATPIAVATGYRVVRERGALACRLVDEEQYAHKINLPQALEGICRRITFPADAKGGVVGGSRANLTKIEEESGALCFWLDAEQANHVTLAIIGSEAARTRAAVLIMAAAEAKIPGTFLCSDGYGPTISISTDETKAVLEEVTRPKKEGEAQKNGGWNDQWWKDGYNGGNDYARGDNKRDWNSASGGWDEQDAGDGNKHQRGASEDQSRSTATSNRPRPPAPPSQSDQAPRIPFGQPPQQCPQVPYHSRMVQQHGWPQSIEEWAANQPLFFPPGPDYPTLPPDFYRVVSRSSGNVYYVRLRDNQSFSSLESVLDEARGNLS